MGGKRTLNCRAFKGTVDHMSVGFRHVRIIASWTLMGLLIAATGAGLFFFIIVTGLSGGDGTMGAAAGACFVLLIFEVSVVMRLIFRRPTRYGEFERLP